MDKHGILGCFLANNREKDLVRWITVPDQMSRYGFRENNAWFFLTRQPNADVKYLGGKREDNHGTWIGQLIIGYKRAIKLSINKHQSGCSMVEYTETEDNRKWVVCHLSLNVNEKETVRQRRGHVGRGAVDGGASDEETSDEEVISPLSDSYATLGRKEVTK
ncbi:unnamed protein product [Arabis nemorensis]|uniref:NAC domain-containing protein n=1 Tax=Arabis nemorensis TaxID=586526 RepID=A0A565BBJ4_9BRAS|nr:unnamed protein product [Arabis nemorensis]